MENEQLWGGGLGTGKRKGGSVFAGLGIGLSVWIKKKESMDIYPPCCPLRFSRFRPWLCNPVTSEVGEERHGMKRKNEFFLNFPGLNLTKKKFERSKRR